MDDDSRRQAEEWTAGITIQVLDWTWRAFDTLSARVLSHVDMTQPFEQLERDLTSKHFIEIQQLFAAETDGMSSIVPHHEFPENESRPGGSGKPPASDISFVWYHNERVAWPIEAKVLLTPGTLAAYLGDLTKFTDGIAAPFSGAGAQVAYLLNGTTEDFFSNLGLALSVALQTMPEFSNRAHRVTSHKRKTTPELRLHHMAMRC